MDMTASQKSNRELCQEERRSHNHIKTAFLSYIWIWETSSNI